jgi:Kef-type K+ transport system membrane component KefB
LEEVITGYLFYEIAAILVIAAAVGFVGLTARQPLIVSFIAVGILVGPSLLDIARSDRQIDLLAELGIALLLFLVGLKLDLKLVRTLGPVALTTGLGQVAFTSAIGFLIGLALGLDATTSFYVAVALTFSSTIIIVKLLSDKREIDALHGRVALGFLIVQDLVVVIAMIALSAAGIGAGQDAAVGLGEIALVFGSGVALLAAVGGFVLCLANPLVERLARAPELLVCFVVGWAALLAAVSHYLGFGKELGGLLAGVSLASTPYREAIAARLASLRDFLLLFFFVALGASLDLGLLGDNLVAAMVLAVFVLVGNPLIVLAIMGAMGYRKRTGFLAGLTVAQISEFSLIFIAVGVDLGHVQGSALGLVTLVGLITISLSTYMITYSHQLYAVCEPLLGVFERHRPFREEAAETARRDGPADVVIFGLGRFGGQIARGLQADGATVLGIDFNPDSVRYWQKHGLSVRYGDATDPELVAHLPLSGVRWVVSAVPEHETGLTHMDPRLALMAALRDAGYHGRIALTTHREEDVERLGEAGADLVLMPFRDAADQAVDLLRGRQKAPLADSPIYAPDDQRELAE